ncbi:MAG: leucyl aminopeptidase [Myxococcota bacterium]|jgi:leucyl aminopeptidase
MEFGRFEGDLTSLEADIVAVGVYADSDWDSGPASEFNDALGKLLAAVAGEEGFEGKDGQSVCFHTHGRIGAGRVLLVGLGKTGSDDGRRLAARTIRKARGLKLKSVGIVAPEGVDTSSLVMGASLGDYTYQTWKTVNPKPSTVTRVDLARAGGDQDVTLAQAMAAGVCFARDLVNEPPVTMTPTIMANKAQEIADETGLECTIFDKAGLEKMGARLILAVSAGSVEEPRLIHLTWRPPGATDKTPSVALVGKGLTFDAGGLCLKPTGSIEEMKMDMGGGAAVLGAMKAIAAVAPDIIVHGIVPSSENLLGAAAYKPGDVFKSYNGKTVEIMNTDAEGRLILADALHYAVALEPDEMIDLATLTGAICVALGNDTVGLFTNDDDMGAEVLASAEAAGESMWKMPLDHRMREQLDSPIADMKNVGKRWGGAITAALFLHEYIGDTTWTHLDIAGPAFSDKVKDHIDKGGTGVAVLTLLEYVKRAGARLSS